MARWLLRHAAVHNYRVPIITKRSISAGEMYSMICVEWPGVDLNEIEPPLTMVWAENYFDIFVPSDRPWPLYLIFALLVTVI